MRYRLTFVPESTPMLPGGRRARRALEGDAGEILDAWNRLPAWGIYEPDEFREAILEFNPGAREAVEGGMPADDDEILRAVAKAAGPDALRLEERPAVVA